MSSNDDSAAPYHEPHVQLDELATGALPEDERRTAEAHVAGCDECRAALESIRSVHAKLREAYDAEPAPSPRLEREVFARIGSSRAPSPSRWSLPRWAQVAAIVLIVAQGGLLLRSMTTVTPSGQVATRALAPASTQLRVVFAPSATEAQIRALLQALDARIVDGPSPSGEYRIELRSADPKAVAEKIRSASAQSDVLQRIDLAP